MGLIGCIVGECATSYHTLLTARIIQGFPSSAFESIMFATIGYNPLYSVNNSDTYFVHQRGLRVSLFNFIAGAVSNL
jgi:hypothetical protein